MYTHILHQSVILKVLQCHIFLVFQLEVEEFEDIKSGYRIKLSFSQNPFFTNDVLMKEFHLATSGDPASQSTPIKWNENMNLIQKALKSQKAMDRKRKLSESRTFFQWFVDNSDPSADDIAEVCI